MKLNKNIVLFTMWVGLTYLLLSVLRMTVLHGDKPVGLFPCADSPVAASTDAKQEHTAYIVERDCGATTDFARHIVITEARDKPNLETNDAVAIAGGQGLKKLHWQENSTLVVEYEETQTKFFRQQKRWHNRRIEYQSR